MNNKTKLKLFYLEKQNNKQSKYLEKTFKEHSIYLKKDIEIKNFIYKLFKNYKMTVSDSKLYYLNNSLHVFVSYHQNCEYSLLKAFEISKKKTLERSTKKCHKKKLNHFIKKYSKKEFKYFIKKKSTKKSTKKERKQFIKKFNKKKFNRFIMKYTKKERKDYNFIKRYTKKERKQLRKRQIKKRFEHRKLIKQYTIKQLRYFIKKDTKEKHINVIELYTKKKIKCFINKWDTKKRDRLIKRSNERQNNWLKKKYTNKERKKFKKRERRKYIKKRNEMERKYFRSKKYRKERDALIKTYKGKVRLPFIQKHPKKEFKRFIQRYKKKNCNHFIQKHPKSLNWLKYLIKKFIIAFKSFNEIIKKVMWKKQDIKNQLQNKIKWNLNVCKKIKQLIIKNMKKLEISDVKRIFQKKNLINIVKFFFESLASFSKKKIKILLVLQRLKNNINQIINIKIRNSLRKNLTKLRKYVWQDFFKESINILFTFATSDTSASLLGELIVAQLKKLKRHNFFFRFIKNALKSIKNNVVSNFIKIKIEIKGRLNGRPRARCRTIKIKNTKPILNKNLMIDYSEKMALTANGTLGVKIWVHKLRKCFATKKKLSIKKRKKANLKN